MKLDNEFPSQIREGVKTFAQEALFFLIFLFHAVLLYFQDTGMPHFFVQRLRDHYIMKK